MKYFRVHFEIFKIKCYFKNQNGKYNNQNEYDLSSQTLVYLLFTKNIVRYY